MSRRRKDGLFAGDLLAEVKVAGRWTYLCRTVEEQYANNRVEADHGRIRVAFDGFARRL